MGLFRSKFDKLTREDVVNAICQLETESQRIEEELEQKQARIDELMAKGKTEKNRQTKLFYAKKINALQAEREEDVKRAMYIMYNVCLLNKLKTAIDDNQFFKTSSKMSLGGLLSDQKGLAKFLNKALNTRIAAEDVLTAADETFAMVEEAYEKNESIYGVNEADDQLLAMFETEEAVDGDMDMFAEHAEEKKAVAETSSSDSTDDDK